MGNKKITPRYVCIECASLLAKISKIMSYEERGKWVTEFADHLVNGTGSNDYAAELLATSRERMDKKAEEIQAYREKKKAEEEARKAARSAARKPKEVAEEPRKDMKTFGSNNNVFLSNEEIEKLKEYEYSGVRICRQDILDIIEELSTWKAKGNSTKSDYATILSWFQRRVKQDKEKQASSPKSFQQMQNEYQDKIMEDIYMIRGIK